MNESWKKIATATKQLLSCPTDKRLEYIQEVLKEVLGMERVAFFPIERPMEELKAPGRNKIPFFEYLALQRCPVAVNLSDQDVLPPELNGWSFPNLLFIPLIVRDFVLGMLVLGSNAAREFTPEESELIEALVPQLITLTDAETLLKESKRKSVHQKVLRALDHAILQGDRAESMGMAAELIHRALGVERTMFFTSEGEKSGKLAIACALGCPYANEGTLEDEPCARIAEDIRAKRITLIYNKESISKIGQNRPLCTGRQVVAVPVINKKRFYGVLEVFNRKDGKDFTSHEINLIEQVMDRLALALANNELLEQVQQAGLSSIKSLAAALDAKDKYTNNHSANVARYSFLIAQQLGMSSDFCDRIHLAGLIHDIGKIGIPDGVLNKVEKLTDEDFGLLKQHPTIGARILEPFPHLSDVIEMMYTHHEKIDGRGYPRGLKGEEIPLGGRILAVADSFDAMSSDRKYRSRRPMIDILNEMRRCSGTQFDPGLVLAFFRAFASMGPIDLNQNAIPGAEALAEFLQ